MKMPNLKISLIFFTLLSLTFSIFAGNTPDDSLKINEGRPIRIKDLIIPATLLTYGIVGTTNDEFRVYTTEINAELHEHIDERVSIDDFSQYAPMAAVYGLNAFGVKGKHNFKDRTIILATSYMLMGGTVLAIKSTAKVERPDESSNNSFPSGHTATAFMGAEFLWQEYKDVSLWYGISGYVVATGTGLFRVYNNRHWLTDVAAGAAIGMLSTKVAYCIYPMFKRKRTTNNHTTASRVLLPFYNGKQIGAGLAVTF
jgi:hypothetical protein